MLLEVFFAQGAVTPEAVSASRFVSPSISAGLVDVLVAQGAPFDFIQGPPEFARCLPLLEGAVTEAALEPFIAASAFKGRVLSVPSSPVSGGGVPVSQQPAVVVPRPDAFVYKAAPLVMPKTGMLVSGILSGGGSGCFLGGGFGFGGGDGGFFRRGKGDPFALFGVKCFSTVARKAAARVPVMTAFDAFCSDPTSIHLGRLSAAQESLLPAKFRFLEQASKHPDVKRYIAQGIFVDAKLVGDPRYIEHLKAYFGADSEIIVRSGENDRPGDIGANVSLTIKMAAILKNPKALLDVFQKVSCSCKRSMVLIQKMHREATHSGTAMVGCMGDLELLIGSGLQIGSGAVTACQIFFDSEGHLLTRTDKLSPDTRRILASLPKDTYKELVTAAALIRKHLKIFFGSDQCLALELSLSAHGDKAALHINQVKFIGNGRKSDGGNPQYVDFTMMRSVTRGLHLVPTCAIQYPRALQYSKMLLGVGNVFVPKSIGDLKKIPPNSILVFNVDAEGRYVFSDGVLSNVRREILPEISISAVVLNGGSRGQHPVDQWLKTEATVMTATSAQFELLQSHNGGIMSISIVPKLGLSVGGDKIVEEAALEVKYTPTEVPIPNSVAKTEDIQFRSLIQFVRERSQHRTDSVLATDVSIETGPGSPTVLRCKVQGIAIHAHVHKMFAGCEKEFSSLSAADMLAFLKQQDCKFLLTRNGNLAMSYNVNHNQIADVCGVGALSGSLRGFFLDDRLVITTWPSGDADDMKAYDPTDLTSCNPQLTALKALYPKEFSTMIFDTHSDRVTLAGSMLSDSCFSRQEVYPVFGYVPVMLDGKTTFVPFESYYKACQMTLGQGLDLAKPDALASNLKRALSADSVAGEVAGTGFRVLTNDKPTTRFMDLCAQLSK